MPLAAITELVDVDVVADASHDILKDASAWLMEEHASLVTTVVGTRIRMWRGWTTQNSRSWSFTAVGARRAPRNPTWVTEGLA